MSSGLIRASKTRSSETRESIESMCWTRSHVSGSSSMYSSSTPSVYGSDAPKRWSRTLASWLPLLTPNLPSGEVSHGDPAKAGASGRGSPDHRLGLDLDAPARVEELRADPAQRRPGGGDRLAVCAADRADVLGARDVDPRPQDVVEARGGLAERARDDAH